MRARSMSCSGSTAIVAARISGILQLSLCSFGSPCEHAQMMPGEESVFTLSASVEHQWPSAQRIRAVDAYLP